MAVLVHRDEHADGQRGTPPDKSVSSCTCPGSPSQPRQRERPGPTVCFQNVLQSRVPTRCRAPASRRRSAPGCPGNRARPRGTRPPRLRWRRSMPLARCRRPRPRCAPAPGRETATRSGASKSSRAAATRSSDSTPDAMPFRPAERMRDRRAHVGIAELRQHRAVHVFHHRVHDALRMHDHLDRRTVPSRTARRPRSARGPCSSGWRSRPRSCGPCSSAGARRPAPA